MEPIINVEGEKKIGWPVNCRTVKSRSVKSRPDKSRWTKSRAVKSRSVKSRAVKSRWTKSRAVKSRSVKSRSVKSRSVKSRSIKSQSGKSQFRLLRASWVVENPFYSSSDFTWREHKYKACTESHDHFLFLPKHCQNLLIFGYGAGNCQNFWILAVWFTEYFIFLSDSSPAMCKYPSVQTQHYKYDIEIVSFLHGNL